MIAMYHLSHLIAEDRRRDLIAGGPRVRPLKLQRPRLRVAPVWRGVRA
jgi:hypothetical protein